MKSAPANIDSAATAATAVRERPIVFADAEVRAILAGRKTQMRRGATFGHVPGDVPTFVVEPFPGEWVAWWTNASEANVLARSRKVYSPGDGIRCPFGRVGDRLWVREAWQMRGLLFGRPAADAKFAGRGAFHYRATDETAPKRWRPEWGGWRPARTMPRATSRLTLELAAVRVERLQAISEADCWDEGYDFDADVAERVKSVGRWSPQVDGPQAWYARQWESLNGMGSWAADPWVWALTFRRVESEAA